MKLCAPPKIKPVGDALRPTLLQPTDGDDNCHLSITTRKLVNTVMFFLTFFFRLFACLFVCFFVSTEKGI